MKPALNVVICSTRPGRVGPTIAGWFFGRASQSALFQTKLVDLADFDLPLLDEPNHPRLGQYRNEHTRRWSASVDAADAFVFVTPEYNYGPPPTLVNALDYLHAEWNYKPAAFVSYGGQSGGAKGTHLVTPIFTTLKMVPIYESVAIPFFRTCLDEEGNFSATERMEDAAKILLREIHRWAMALKPLRS